jgi:hypothetical protein
MKPVRELCIKKNDTLESSKNSYKFWGLFILSH